MKIINNIAELKIYLASLRQKNIKLYFCPTMGFLHKGHLSLMKKASKYSGEILVSIFVNKLQFNNNNDFSSYPRSIQNDIDILKEIGIVDIVYLPQHEEIFNNQFDNFVYAKKFANCLCGQYRGSHMQGVLTIITIFLNQIRPDTIILGLKDYQQYFLIRNLVRDLSFDTKVIGVETYREKSGLAMSSRNSRLSENARINIAPKTYHMMKDFILKIKDLEYIKKTNELDVRQALNNIQETLKTKNIDKFDYFEIRDSDNLELINNFNDITNKSRLFSAFFVEGIRLIDNVNVGEL